MRNAEIRKRNLQTFNEIAEEYDLHRQAPWSECIAPLISLGNSSLILDVGAGTGRQALALSKQELNVVALDFSPKMLARLRIGAASFHLESRISIVVGDLAALPFRSSAFDGIELVAALHHIPSRHLRSFVMRELYRATVKGGRCVISVWLRSQRGFYCLLLTSSFRLLSGKSEWGDVWIAWGRRPRFYHLFSSRELRSIVSSSGFRIEKMETKSFGREGAKKLNRNLLVEARKT